MTEAPPNKTEVPPNIQEFNTIAGLIFAQLFKAFPIPEDIDRDGIAKTFGVVGTDWGTHILPSGRSFNVVLSNTVGWLNVEEYTKAFGAQAAQRVLLTTKGLAAMNAVRSELKQPLGTELRKAVEGAPKSQINLSAIGDLIGGFFGGYTKSIGS
jgi:hypothetical protein